MSNPNNDKLKEEINHLEDSMHDAEKPHTLEEQVADMKRRGIDPSKSYKEWDDQKEDDWGNETWKENGKWEHKTPEDLDPKAKEEWDGENGKPNPPPIV
ncbi:hypothetical protein [Psychrobacter sp.]|uniref:hypothetical protein n=1 Tax=Psychrobacter sp. TaxID=56811 RepID=UPI0025F0F763|nr:hypothetical protein [Psychrobacter sp.]